MPQLRPMSTGEILDRTFSNYRRNFKLFAGIAAIPNAILLVFKLLIVLVVAANAWTPAQRVAGGAALTFTIVSTILAFIFYLVSLAVSQGATAYAVSAVHLEIPTTIRECYGRIKGRYGRMVNVIVSVGLRVFGVLLLSYLAIVVVAAIVIPVTMRGGGTAVAVAIGLFGLAAFVAALFWGVRLFARYSLAVPACVVEDIKARAAIKRSVFLSKGSVGKILAIYVLVLVINLVVAFGVAIPIQMALFAAKTTLIKTMMTVLQEIGSFVVGSVVGPLVTIALSLVYFDERVRKEAFDIQYMMQFLPQAPAQAAAAPVADIPAPVAEPLTAPDVQPETAAPAEPRAEGAGTTNS